VPTRILIVDDSAIIRRRLRSFLQSQSGLEVCGEAADGMEALEKAAELKPNLIVLDFSMPKMNGLEAAAALHKIMPKVPVVLFTLHKDAVLKDAVLRDMAEDAGISSIVSKTEQTNTLSQEIRRLVGAA
jgi:DNA-binding NarL/FixJ family response regulator